MMKVIDLPNEVNEEDFNVILYISPPLVTNVIDEHDRALWSLRSASRWPTS